MKTIEEIQTQLDEIQKDLNTIKSQEEGKIKVTILVGGLKFALHNLGTDEDNPYGKYYTWDEAMEACPKGWRLPTHEEWVLFFINTTQEWIEDKEAINGMKFTDKVTGKSIFLPAMGWNFDLSNNFGYYWSSSCSSPCPSDVFYLCSNYGSYVDPSDYANRSYGFSVRCIKY